MLTEEEMHSYIGKKVKIVGKSGSVRIGKVTGYMSSADDIYGKPTISLALPKEKRCEYEYYPEDIKSIEVIK